MSASFRTEWFFANQRALASAFDELCAQLENYCARERREIFSPPFLAPEPSALTALDMLCENLQLSRFERALVLLCAGIELDERVPQLCAQAHDDAQKTFPTFALALAALPDAHWSALLPHSSLRYWRVLELENPNALTHSALRADERIVHYLMGETSFDARLDGLLEPLRMANALTPSEENLATRMNAEWRRARVNLPVLVLRGASSQTARALAANVCAEVGLHAYALDADALPPTFQEVEALARLWEREAVLQRGALLMDAVESDLDAARIAVLRRFLERTHAPLLVATRAQTISSRRATRIFEMDAPTTQEQRALWQSALGETADALNGQVEQLIAQFHLSPAQIQTARAQAAQADTKDLPRALWDACRAQARPALDELAPRLTARATWADLVLPERQLQTLREIAAQVRTRAVVYDTWGFETRSSSGFGITALFAGESGTGKTMAAEVLANELRLDLYRIDLSQVVSKYIGETEKNLRRVFDAAESGGAILLFDEADALFGKRSEVKDSHDRYANIEVSYLLQRMEQYRGLAILTTNLKNALDPAFARRIRFVAHFPFPDTPARAEIWKRIFPAQTPTDALDAAKLARLNVAGGNIRNIALNAAFLAADAREPIRMQHLLRAARSEYAKLEKQLTDSEIGGWT